MLVLLLGLLAACKGEPPRPNERQLEYMELELSQFMHFGLGSFWDPPESFLRSANPTYHNCYTTGIDRGPQTAGSYPCLSPELFAPTELDPDEWMRAAAAMGSKEICLTAAHEGGFALWPSNYTDYSVRASKWRGGRGDVLREFADAAKLWGIRICYYIQVSDDGWGMHYANFSDGESFIKSQLGRLSELLEHYGPVYRFWFDGAGFAPNFPPGMDEQLNVAPSHPGR